MTLSSSNTASVPLESIELWINTASVPLESIELWIFFHRMSATPPSLGSSHFIPNYLFLGGSAAETRYYGDLTPLPIPELDLDHSLVAAHDFMQHQHTIYTNNGYAKVCIFGSTFPPRFCPLQQHLRLPRKILSLL